MKNLKYDLWLGEAFLIQQIFLVRDPKENKSIVFLLEKRIQF